MTIWMWRRKADAGSIAEVALALALLLAVVQPSAAQEQPGETFQLPYNHQPLALAYLAAPYAGGPTGPSSPDFSAGGASVVARFLPRAGLQPWEGIPFGLFKRTTLLHSGTRVGVTGNAPGIGSGRPLDLKLYAFLPSEQSVPSVRLLTYESDAWKRRPDTFTVLSDTTFVLTAPIGGGGDQDGHVSNAPGGANQGLGPGYAPQYGKGDGSGSDTIACVNKRSTSLDGRSLSCEEGTGEVVEDPLSGEPALLMLPRRGPPQWLTSVPTEICIEDAKMPPRIAVPYGGNFMPISLVERKGQHLCTGGWRLDYLQIKQSGIEVDGVRHRRLGSRSAIGSGWKLLAEAPGQTGTSWVQRIVLVPPAPPTVGAPKPPSPTPPVPVPLPSAPHPTLAVILNGWRWSLSIRKLWYGPLPAGGDASRSFKCENGALSLGTAVWGKDKLIEADAVSVKRVFKIPPALRLQVTQPTSKLTFLRHGLVFVAEGSAGNTYCGIATPLQPGGAEFEGKVHEEKAAPPRAPLPPVTPELALPAELFLKPVVHLGKRPLALASCKITLAGYPDGEFRHERDGRTRVKIGPDKRGRPGASYGIEVGGTAKVCTGFEGEALPAQKLAALAKGAELTIPIRRRGGRAFVGVLSWPVAGPDEEGNWRAALKALVDTFDAGANEGRYLWGAIYAPDGKKLVTSGETADYAPLEPDAFSAETMSRFKAGRAALRYEDAVKRAVADVTDLEGNVDLLVVATGVEGACKWTNPFVFPGTKGGRSALVRVVKAAPRQATDAASRARICEVDAGKDDVGIAVEVAVDPPTAGGASDRLLREALEAAARSLLAAPESAPKAEAEPPRDKVASVAPAPVGQSGAADTYQDRYELPDDYRPLAVAYLAAPYTGSLTGPASTFRVGAERPGNSLFARFLKRADEGARPWAGIPFGLFKGKAGHPDTQLSLTDGALALGLGGNKVLHPTLYLFVSEELRVVGLQKMMTFESDAGRKAGDVFSVLSDTSFVLRAYLEAPSIGIESIACVNKGSLQDAPAACEGNTGEVVEDPLAGGPALLMTAGQGLPKWLAAVATEICVEGASKTPPKVAVPIGSGQHKEVKFMHQGERWCTGVSELSYAAVREAGIRIGGEPPRKRLDSRLKTGAGVWSLRATAPSKGPGGDWVQQLVLNPPG